MHENTTDPPCVPSTNSTSFVPNCFFIIAVICRSFGPIVPSCGALHTSMSNRCKLTRIAYSTNWNLYGLVSTYKIIININIKFAIQVKCSVHSLWFVCSFGILVPSHPYWTRFQFSCVHDFTYKSSIFYHLNFISLHLAPLFCNRLAKTLNVIII